MVVDHTDVGAAFRRLSIPVAISMLGDQLLGIVDTIAIGSLGTVALAGATAATSTFMAVAFGAIGFMTGTSILAAQRIGAHDVDGFARTVRAGVAAPLAAGIAALAASLVLSGRILHALLGDLASGPPSATYLTLRCASILPIAISGTLISGLGSAGNRKLGVYVLLAINLVHVPLVLALGLGWWTHHPFGIAGAGMSSLISETVGAIFAIAYVARRPEYRIFSRIDAFTRESLELAWDSARLGFPEAVFLLALMLPDVFIVGMLAPLGPSIVSAFRALLVVSDLTFVVPSPLQSAVQTVVGQRLGARDVAGARTFLAGAQRYSFVVTMIAAVLVGAFAWPLAFVITLNASVASIAALPLALHMTALPIKGWAMVALAPIRASGDTRFSMIVGVMCGALVLPLTWFGIERLHLGLYSIPIAWILAWAARAFVTQRKLAGDEWTERPPLAAA